jgi:D-alanyl-D-alanine carboxypeptidase/D-alanyl-D-alanine-endopeptidase (penicillin-binding protein 4)
VLLSLPLLSSCAVFGGADPVQGLGWLNAPFFQPPPEPDRAVTQILDNYLQRLRSRGISPEQQGVFIQAGLTRLAVHRGEALYSAASLTKIATTLAAVEKWGLNHRFVTTVATTGVITDDGILTGDLIVQGNSNPFFVWEEAIAVGNALNAAGIQAVAGDLVIVGPFYMNYRTEVTVAGELLRVALDRDRWPPDAQEQYKTLPTGTPQPQIAIQGEVRVSPNLPSDAIALFRHESINLANILRQMNIYSNNVMAEVLAESTGGAAAVANLAAQVSGVQPDEIQLINGSGLGVENRISPHATVAMLIALDRRLQNQAARITDVFPVVERDRGGTLKGRDFPPQTLLKTGTLNTVSALAGVVPTRDRGWVWYAIINNGSAQIPYLRQEQDVLLQEITQALGTDNLLTGQGAIVDEPLGDPARIIQ